MSNLLSQIEIETAKQTINLIADIKNLTQKCKEKVRATLSKTQLQNLANQLTKGTFQVKGKSTFKEEFVTAGGINLKEINFKTMESKLHENLYFAGEIVNIDAITGGFNFQNAWTSGFIVANAV